MRPASVGFPRPYHPLQALRKKLRTGGRNFGAQYIYIAAYPVMEVRWLYSPYPKASIAVVRTEIRYLKAKLDVET